MPFKFTIAIPKLWMLLLVYLYGLLNGSSQINAQNIPDTNFAAAIRTDCPTCIDASNNLLPPAASLTFLNLHTKNITNLTGIGGFTGLERLDCRFNQLTTLPVLPASLIKLECSGNQLTILPALPNTLTWLECSGNQLTSLPALPTGLTYL